jgi:sulfur carrier protein ThiS
MIHINHKPYPYVEEETLKEALQRAGLCANPLTLLLLDGKVFHYETAKMTKVSDGTSILVMQIVSGG